MGVRKLSEHNIRKITKLGNKSLAVTLPVEMVAKLKWKEKQKVVVKQKAKHLLSRIGKIKFDEKSFENYTQSISSKFSHGETSEVSTSQ